MADDHPTGGGGESPPTLIARVQQLFVTAFAPKGPTPGTARAAPTGSPTEAAGGGAPSTEAEPDRPLSDAQVKEKVTQIDSTERKIGLAGVVLAVVIGLVGLVPGIEHPTQHVYRAVKAGAHDSCQSGYAYHDSLKECVQYAHRSVWIWELVIVLVFALALLVAVRVGRRSAVAFALIMTGFALEFAVQSILAIPFVFAGGWLVVRAWRVQRYGSPNASAAARRAADADRRKGKAPAAAAQTGGRGKTTAGRATTAGSRGKTKSAEVVGAGGRPKPGANKRYTPKAPPRKRPPPPES